MFSILASLPQEILQFHLLPLLTRDDIISLLLVCEINVSRELYRRVFPNDREYDHYDLWMFRERALARIAFFGGHRVSPWIDDGSLRKDFFQRTNRDAKWAPRECKRLGIPHTRNPRMHTAVELRGVTVTSICGDKFVDGEGNIRFASAKPPIAGAGISAGFVRARPPNLNAVDLQSVQRNCGPEWVRWVQSYTDPHFVDFTGFIGLDESGKLWHWPGDDLTKKGIPALLVKGPILEQRVPPLVTEKVLRIRSNDGRFCALLEGRGIVSWISTTKNVFTFPRRYRVFAIRPVDESQNVADFAVLGDDTLVFINSDGKLMGCFLETMENYEIESVNQICQERHLGRLVQVDCCGTNFTAVTDGGYIICCSLKERVNSQVQPGKIKVISTLKEKGVERVCALPGFQLALSKEGEVYSWGKEKHYEGCLGLGKVQGLERMDVVTSAGSNLRVKRPTLMKTGGKVFDIGGGDEMSCFLVCPVHMRDVVKGMKDRAEAQYGREYQRREVFERRGAFERPHEESSQETLERRQREAFERRERERIAERERQVEAVRQRTQRAARQREEGEARIQRELEERERRMTAGERADIEALNRREERLRAGDEAEKERMRRERRKRDREEEKRKREMRLRRERVQKEKKEQAEKEKREMEEKARRDQARLERQRVEANKRKEEAHGGEGNARDALRRAYVRDFNGGVRKGEEAENERRKKEKVQREKEEKLRKLRLKKEREEREKKEKEEKLKKEKEERENRERLERVRKEREEKKKREDQERMKRAAEERAKKVKEEANKAEEAKRAEEAKKVKEPEKEEIRREKEEKVKEEVKKPEETKKAEVDEEESEEETQEGPARDFLRKLYAQRRQ